MKTVQMTLDEILLKEVDKEVQKLNTTRSEFTRAALKKFLDHLHKKELEEKHRQGYLKRPVKPKEFDVWANEQIWVD